MERDNHRALMTFEAKHCVDMFLTNYDSITGWAEGPSQREDLCLAMTLGVWEQEGAAAAHSPQQL